MEKPPIRILQRPCPESANIFSESAKPSSIAKSLEQREADYAAARRRIMGSLPEMEALATPSSNGIGKNVAVGNGQSGTSATRQSTNSQNTGTTPLMSIQASLVTNTNTGLTSDFGLTPTTVVPTGGNSVQSRANHNNRHALAIVNVAQKLQQQSQPSSNTTHSSMQSQQRVLPPSVSSPAMLHSARSTQQADPLLTFQLNSSTNAGLLPTVPGFNYAHPSTTVNGVGMQHSHSAAVFALMQQFSLLQQYHPTLNGFENHLLPSMTHANASFNHMNFPSIVSQPNKKFTYPPAFN